jgi:microcystin-dependent protein
MFTDPYMATITNFAGNFAPMSWMFCQGQLLSIAEYNALFALIGTTYGGDGQTTFGLPDFRSRIAIHMGQGQGLSNYQIGQMAGTESVTMVPAQLPAHSHTLISFTPSVVGTTVATGVAVPNNAVPAAGSSVYSTTPDGNTLGASSVSGITPASGSGGVPISIIQPYVSMNFIIAVQGIFPSRN